MTIVLASTGFIAILSLTLFITAGSIALFGPLKLPWMLLAVSIGFLAGFILGLFTLLDPNKIVSGIIMGVIISIIIISTFFPNYYRKRVAKNRNT
jgi:hypothetical protein